jgi:hypothetical protein
MNPGPSWVDQYSEAAKDGEQDNAKVEQEHNVCRESIDYDASPMGRLT